MTKKFIIFTAFILLLSQCTKVEKHNLVTISELVRIGWSEGMKKEINLLNKIGDYESTAFLKPLKVLKNSKGEIKIPFKQIAELEIKYKDIDKFSVGSFTYEVTENKSDLVSTSGSIYRGRVGNSTQVVNKNRAIIYWNPWLYVGYGDGGKVKLILEISTDSNKKFIKEWVFHVGRNPEVYKEIY
ncbi:MAG: hypothetical protein GY754_05170 [bacterium]|nr:hypothetical protein [bacterium]